MAPLPTPRHVLHSVANRFVCIEGCWGVLWGVYGACVAVYLHEHLNLAAPEVVLLTSFALVVSPILEVPCGYLADRVGVRPVVSLAFILVAVSAGAYTFSSLVTSPVWPTVLVIVAEIVIAISYALYSRAWESWTVRIIRAVVTERLRAHNSRIMAGDDFEPIVRSMVERLSAHAGRLQAVGMVVGGAVALGLLQAIRLPWLVWSTMAVLALACLVLSMATPRVQLSVERRDTTFREELMHTWNVLKALPRPFWTMAALFALFALVAFVALYYVPMIVLVAVAAPGREAPPWLAVVTYMVVGMPALLGSQIAVVATRSGIARRGRLVVALAAASLGATGSGVFVLLAGESWAVVLLIVWFFIARCAFPIAKPGIDALLHEHVRDDTMRTTAMSVAEMAKEILILVAGVTFFVAAWLNRESEGVAASQATLVAFWLIGTGVFVAVMGLALLSIPALWRTDSPPSGGAGE